ncbi:MAG: Crp/Fnr family transcriptional regulator [Crocinitomicaceae bacterium]|nr:Crp/Fnr family transcriptional regulator [Crocinitomicaceae bacterium]
MITKNKNIKCEECENSLCILKKYCTAQELTLVSLDKTTSVLKKGNYVFCEGDFVRGIFFIQNGSAKVISDTLNNRQQIVRLSKTGNIIGYRALGKVKYYFNAVALTDLTICFIDNELYHNLCKINNELTYHLMLQYAYELGRTGLRMKYQSQMNTREKIAEAFIYLNEVFGTNSETKKLNIAFSRQDLADLAGTTPEQISRQLSEFEKEGAIKKHKRDIEITNLGHLQSIVKKYKIE